MKRQNASLQNVLLVLIFAEFMVIILIRGFQPLNIITKHSILDVAAVLDPPLSYMIWKTKNHVKSSYVI